MSRKKRPADGKIPLLGGLTLVEFLERHWHKRPLLVRGAFADFGDPIAAEDLAALACDDRVTSRLVGGDGDTRPWSLRHGPFDDADFAGLESTHWTLLVQEVDRWVPAVAALLDPFDFVPNWRLDDVMVSYATPGGSVGPHVDNYDVFLIQGRGRRRWRIREHPLTGEQLRPDTELRVLRRFEPDLEWDLEPGDMLYLPPRIAHHGIALDECLTYSVGFHAPAQRDLLAAYSAHALETIDPDWRYADPDLPPTKDPGELTAEALARLRDLLVAPLRDAERMNRWLGLQLTEPRRESDVPVPDARGHWRAALERSGRLERGPRAHMAWVRRDDGGAFLYVAGEEYGLDRELARFATLLCGTTPLTRKTLTPLLDDPRVAALIHTLVRRGCLRVPSEED